MGKNGSKFLSDGDIVMTHCNAGALATGGYGTALGVIRAAVETTLGIAAKIRLVEPKVIARSEGKAVRVIDKRKLI